MVLGLADGFSMLGDSVPQYINSKVKELEALGQKVYNFSVGEPDFSLFPEVRDAGILALRENFAKYTPAAGIEELRVKIAEKLTKENGILCSAADVIVTSGAKQAIYNALYAVVNSGEEVLIPSPYWTSYAAQVHLCRAQPVFAKTDDFVIKADLLELSITPKTKILILNSPNNPTGTVISKSELKRIADLVLSHDIYVMADEIYERFVYEDEHYSLASLNDEIRDRTITINGFSKTYAMTGLRLGYATAPKEIIKMMNRIQSQTTLHPSSISQKMGVAALSVPLRNILPFVQEYKKRRDFVVRRLNEMNLDCCKPQGAFFVFPSIESLGISSQSCSTTLLEHGIATAPGIAFGSDHHIRLSYATSMAQIEEGLENMEKVL